MEPRAAGNWRRAAERLGGAIALIALLAPAGEARAVEASEYEVKAAFLLHFVRLVEWPGDAGGEAGPLVLGVLGPDPFDGALDALLAEERVDGRPLAVRRLERAEEARRCQLVFVPAGESHRVSELGGALEGAGVLLVTEGEGLARRGAAINFYAEGGRIRFEVNRRAAERAGLKLSSRLLRLARLVGE